MVMLITELSLLGLAMQSGQTLGRMDIKAEGVEGETIVRGRDIWKSTK